ncbi:RMD1 family protein [Psychrosphaera sp. 1_MG-2023]|uniref:RMD1 family protein n=1 Tax=Psychrosphaera sp. 1_MG-2023 TaxID=3062643 RepID=UPI0026E385D3|nr:RMD1 family protein [Psychrosphaera sp. 1_MG-2023]MDO6719279.1 RMD1 family protein [Psychrosphaera sp. 1_MG-2023]
MTTDKLMSTTEFCHDRVSVFNVGDEFCSETEIQAVSTDQPQTRFRDAVRVVADQGEYWLFDYGVVVFWGMDEEEIKRLVAKFVKQSESNLEKIEEHYLFGFANEIKISKDFITLPDNNPLSRLAVSHALAQSIKLVEFEQNAQNTIVNHSHLPETLAKSGKIALSRKHIAKIRGMLFRTKSDIILHYGLLDTPEFFWEYPEYEHIYNALAKYMDIHPRVELLSKKLETIHELFEMLADEQKHQHSSFLEWIIIILIAIEIVIYFVELAA